MPEQKQVEIKEAKLVEVPTQYAPAFELEDGSIVDERTLLLKIYNKINKIEKTIV